MICGEIFLLAAKYRPIFGRIFAKRPADSLGAKISWTENCRSKATVCWCLRHKQVFLIKLLGTWFRFLIKQIRRDSPNTDAFYVWDKIGFFTYWLPDHHVVLCFDLPSALQSRLQSALSSNPDKFRLNDPYSIHTFIVKEVSSLFDISVWSLRDLVRMVEKVTSLSIPRINYHSKIDTGT